MDVEVGSFQTVQKNSGLKIKNKTSEAMLSKS